MTKALFYLFDKRQNGHLNRSNLEELFKAIGVSNVEAVDKLIGTDFELRYDDFVGLMEVLAEKGY